MEQNRLEALAAYLVLDYLEKEGVSSQLRNALIDEFSNKHLFQHLITLDGIPKPATYPELASQLPVSTQPVLKNVLYNQSKIQRKTDMIERWKKAIEESVNEKYDIFSPRLRRDRLLRRNRGRRGFMPRGDFPSEMFTSYWTKLKSIFGHIKKIPDPEDPINGSPVYNLSYDKTGKYIISGADDGLIKIWSTTNGELVNTLIGHDADINATALSECGKYLASCSNRGMVRVWHLESGEPLAVFNDHAGVVCSLNFFRIPAGNDRPGEFQAGLASASDDGTVKIYFQEDFVNNQGALKQDQRHLTLKIEDLTTSSKGFSSIEFHPDGYMAAGTSGGSIIIWNKLLEIDTAHIDKHRIIKNEHSKDCHLTLWNKDGTKLLSASFDGTAKVWPWNASDFNSNRDMKTIFVFEGDLGKGVDIKCCAVAWSCNGRFAITSFCKKINKRGDDNAILQANIQIYDSKANCRAHKFDRTYEGGMLENYIFILEPHPYNDSILMSADYDGKVIIWNIELGIMLNCFIENCGHVGLPLLEAPILDGRFSPDGMNFCIATYYGSITLYGYGEKDMFITTPTQQFFSKEFVKFEIDSETYRVIAMDGGVDMHLIGKGVLCSANKKEYPRESIMPDDYLDFDETSHYRKYVEAIEKQRHEGKQEIEGINSKDCLNSLKTRIQDIIKLEIDKLCAKFLNRGHRRRMLNPEIVGAIQKLNEAPIDARYGQQGSGMVVEQPHSQDTTRRLLQQNIEDAQTREAIERIMLEDSDYDPDPPGELESRPTLTRGTARRRRGRRSRAEIEAMERERMQEEEEEHKNNLLRMEEEEDEEVTLIKRRGSHRRSNRLLLDDDDEEKEDEKEDLQTRRSERRRRTLVDEPQEEAVSRNTGTIEERRRTARLGSMAESIRNRREDLLRGQQPRPGRLTHNAHNTMEVEENHRSVDRRGLASARRGGLSTGPGRSDREFMDVGLRQTVLREQSRWREAQNMAANANVSQRMVRSRSNVQETIEEHLCSRCGVENARVKCSDGCSRVFHARCSKKHGRDNDMGSFTCFSCLYNKRKKDKIRGVQVQRKWPDVVSHDPKVYIPQVGDTVTYIAQAHEEFIASNFEILRFSKGEVYPFEQFQCLLRDNVCLIKNTKYQFPLNPHKSGITPSVLMKIQLEIVEPKDFEGEQFSVTYYYTRNSDFLIPRESYLSAVKHLETLQKETILYIRHNGVEKPAFLSERAASELVGPFANSYWHSLVLFDHSDDAAHGQRRSRRESDKMLIHASPWDVLQGDLLHNLAVDDDITKERRSRLIDDITRLCETKSDISEYFMADVDKKSFPEYLREIPFEMNMLKIISRIEGEFYRHRAALQSDVELIRYNAERYNGEDSEVTKLAGQLIEEITHVIDKEFGTKSTLSSSVKPTRPRGTQRRRESHGEDESTRKDDKEIHKETTSIERGYGRHNSHTNTSSLPTSGFKTPQLPADSERRVLRSSSIDGVESSDKRHVRKEPEVAPARMESRTRSTRHQQEPQTTEMARPGSIATRLRARPHKEEELGKTAVPAHLSREERMARRLKSRGEVTGEEEDQPRKKNSIDDDTSYKEEEEEEEEKDEVDIHVGGLQKPQNQLSLSLGRLRNRPAIARPTETREVNRYGKRPGSHHHEENKKEEEQTSRVTSLRSRALRKTDTMLEKGDEGLGMSDGSESVGERRPRRKNERGYRTKLRNVQKTYTQYFDKSEEDEGLEDLDSEEEEAVDEEDEEEEKEEKEENDAKPVRPRTVRKVKENRESDFEGEDEDEEEEEEDVGDNGDDDDWDVERPVSKARVIEGQNGEQGQGKRYSTRRSEKL